MMRTIAVAAVTASTAIAGRLITGPSDKIIEGEYIVKLSANHSGRQLRAHVQGLKDTLGADIEVRRVFEQLSDNGFSAFSCKLSPAGLAFIMRYSDYEYVEMNKEVNINDCLAQSNPEWGLTRTNIRGAYTAGPYQYTTGASGVGVDAYVIDTGIYCENVEFVNKATGSCTWGYDFVDGTNKDGNGHGTHCAGTIGGITYGVAKEANLVAVRVLNNRGSGSLEGVIAGINWTAENAKKTGRPSVASMSLGSSYSQSVNDATESAVASGVLMMVAAGNDNQNACNYSPASAASAITVGATEITDIRASYSNYGQCLDLFAPGSNIKSAWIGSPTATNTISGTSMATPHVTGVAAKYLSKDNTLTTSELSAKLVNDATAGVVKNADGGVSTSPENKSPNLLAYGFCT